MFKSNNLKPGSKALIIGAYTAYGKRTVVGKICTLISFVPTGDTKTNAKPDRVFLPTSEPGWLVKIDSGWISNHERRDNLLDPTKPIIASRFLMPLDDPDLDKEIRLDSVRDLVKEKFKKVW